MYYTKQDLERKNIYSLRVIGREIGVRAPSALKKQNLIENILSVQSGKIVPHFAKSGRPSMDIEQIERKEKKKQFVDLEKELYKILKETQEKIINLIAQK